jgi:hypothetical protein
MPLADSPDETEHAPGAHPASARSTADRIVPGRHGEAVRARIWLWAGGGVLALAAVAVGFVFATRSSGPVATPSPTPTRAAFTFPLGKVDAVTVVPSKPSVKAREIAAKVQTSLSDLYAEAFLDPRSWSGKPPPAMWTAFGAVAGDRAQADASAFTLAGTGKVASLTAMDSSLDVQVLYDQRSRPIAAFATVRFQAAGALATGAKVEVVSTAELILRNVSGTWLIVGYPKAKTQLQTAAPSPTSSGSVSS